MTVLILLLLLSLLSRVQLCATPKTAAHQAPLSLGFSRQEHWSGLPFPSPVRESEVAELCPTLLQPHGLQPTRLLHPWDFPGKSTRVGCHCLLQLILLLQLKKKIKKETPLAATIYRVFNKVPVNIQLL